MDEDEYVAKVEKIIERDFFPELEKLKAQSEYIDARDRNDLETMSRLEEKYSGVRPDTGRSRNIRHSSGRAERGRSQETWGERRRGRE